MVPARERANSDLRGVAMSLLSALGFSSLGIWGKLASESGLATYTILPWRFGLVALGLLLVGRQRLPLRDRFVLLGSGLLYVAATACYFAALSRITATATSLLLYLSPAFVVLYARLLGRRPTRPQLVAVALTLLGLVLVMGLPGPGDRDPLGLLAGVATGGLYGAYLVAGERWLERFPPLVCTAHMTLAAALCFAAAGLFTGTLGMPHGMRQWGVTLGMIVFPTLVAVPLLYASIARIGAARASVIATTEPLWTVLLAALVLGETLRPAVLGGGALILGGAVLSQRGARPAAQ
jgi:drug/metabolite transporter (DMT)-like permease